MSYVVQRLLNAPPLLETEIPASYVSRLAAFYRSESARDFCADFGMDFELIAAGAGSQLSKIADLTGADIDAMKRNGPIRQLGHQFAVGAEVLPTAQLSRVQLWMCLDCIREDLDSAPSGDPVAAIGVRRNNIVSAIGSCLKHRKSFTLLGKCEADYMIHDFAHYLADVPRLLPILSVGQLSSAPSQFDYFASGRLDGTTGSVPLLDRLSLSAAMRVVGWFGNLAVSGAVDNLRQMDRAKLSQIYAAGFNILATGAEGIADFIGTRVKQLGPLVSPTLNTVLPKYSAELYKRRKDPTFFPVRKALVEAAEMVLPNVRGTLLGVPTSAPKWSTLPVAARQLPVGPIGLRHMAVAAGAAFYPYQDETMWVDLPKLRSSFGFGTDSGADSMLKVAGPSPRKARSGAFYDSASVKAKLGLSPQAFKRFLELGVLAPRSAVTHGQKVSRLFSPEDVEAFAIRLCQGAPQFAEIPSGFIDLRSASGHFRGSMDTVCRAVIERTIWVGCLTGRAPYQALLIRTEEVRRLLEGSAPALDSDAGNIDVPVSEALTHDELAVACGIGKVACHQLMQSAFFAVTSPRRASGYRKKLVPISEVHRFKTDYVTLHRLARDHGAQKNKIRSLLADRGVYPLDLGDIPITIFRRKDIEGWRLS